MTECESDSEKCLFVSDFACKCIRKVCLKEGTPKVSKFADVPYPPNGLSITPEGNLLVSCDPDKLLELSVTTGEIVFEMQLLSDIVDPKLAIKRKDSQYVVSCDVKYVLHRVCIVGPDGYLRHEYGGMDGPGDLQLRTPCYLAIGDDDHVLVADKGNGRIVLLNSELQFVSNLCELDEPHRLFFDSGVKRLYVGEGTSGNVKVFQVDVGGTKTCVTGLPMPYNKRLPITRPRFPDPPHPEPWRHSFLPRHAMHRRY